MNNSNKLLFAFLKLRVLSLLALSLVVLDPHAASSCTPPVADLVSWWPAEGSGADAVGNNNGVLFSGTTFTSGNVGQAFNFDGVNSAVVISGASNLAFSSLTIEGWILPGDLNTPRPIVEYGNATGPCAMNFWYNMAPGITANPGGLFGFIRTPNGGPSIDVGSTSGLLALNQWSHVAITYDFSQRIIKLYHNGVMVGVNTSPSSIQAQSLMNVNLGYRPAGSADLFGGRRHVGKLDEFAIYTRALTSSEIAAIYDAGSAGKCPPPTPPFIYSQPAAQSTFAGGSVLFSVGAGGSPALSYQWRLNGTNLSAAASASSLALTNVQFDQAGNYSIAVTNQYGSLVSSNALLTVTSAPPCAPVPNMLASWWRAEDDAHDDEGGNHGTLNGVSFASGKVGQAWSFNGSGAYVAVPANASLNLGVGPGMSMECWIKPADLTSGKVIAEWNDGLGNIGVQLMISIPDYGGLGSIFCDVIDTAGSDHYFASNPNVLTTNFQHIAFTYDKASGVGKIFLNAAQVATANLGSVTPRTSAGFYAGKRISGPRTPSYYNGLLDELSLYGRALNVSEIQAIYVAGLAGKCTGLRPPVVVAQPASQTVVLGDNSTFTVMASGTAPLAYQWTFNGTNITDATNSSFTITNVQYSDAGNYLVQVTNPVGSTNSSPATLTVNPPPPCTGPAPNLVSWWRAEGTAEDFAGGNTGTLFPGTTFAPGKVGQAFSFDGATSAVVIPAASNLAFVNLTVEAWLMPMDLDTPRPIVEYGNTNGLCAMNIWYNAGEGASDRPGALSTFFRTPNNNLAIGVASPGGLLVTNQWNHVAVTYDYAQRIVTLYHNGINVGAATSSVPVQPQSFMNVNLGQRPAGSADLWAGRRLKGKLDEASIYTRALAPNEIQAIYNAGKAGKCPVPVAPFIVSQPLDRTVTVGSNATFNVVAGGTPPLSYQWNLNGTSLPFATNASLLLTNVLLSQSGNYSVTVTNAGGAIVSSNAVLSVVYPPALVRASSVTNMAGTTVSLPVILTANGNENALGFSLNFATSRLAYATAVLGSNASNATLLVNNSQATNGVIGFALALPSGATFPAGAQRVLDLSLTSSISPTTSVTTVSFADSPVAKQLSDVPGNPLLVGFSNATVVLSPTEFEGDIAPRPNGNHAVGITDWVTIGNFAARLDYPTNASEFQRADCAPRATLGDGAITVSDWVQAGRYAAGFDPWLPLGGPTSENPLAERPKPRSLERRLRIASMFCIQNQPATLSVNLEGLGNENALGFSISYDAAQFAFLSAALGNGATNAMLNLNTNHISNGHVACVLALPTGATFPVGTNAMLKITLRPSMTASGLYSVAIGDQPIPREISDAAANALPTTYFNGMVTVNPGPTLRIALNATNVVLAWPQWASNFALQESSGSIQAPSPWSNILATPAVTNSESTVILPLTNSTRFYRLYQP